MTEGRYNLRNPAVKRILQEMREMDRDDSVDFVAQAFEENIFEWHFVIRGPPETDFEGGLYHGRISLPSEYPMKPPSFTMYTKNGRFETNTKICLSISDYHPEQWQPSWSMRTALMALVAFLPTPGKGALGFLDLNSEIRKKLAAASRNQIVEFGNEERNRMAKELHEKLLERLERMAVPPSEDKATMRDAPVEAVGTSEVVNNGPAVRIPDGHSSEWIWTSLYYILGFLILAMIAKKFLNNAGFTDASD